MIDAIRYVNSIGEEIVFGEGFWHYGKTDIFDTSCAHRSIGGRITGFERDIREMSLTVELAGPGFLNFRLGSRWFGDTVACVEAEGADYGRNDTLAGKKYMVEFVSANPTGPMHMGNARGGVLGDTLANVLKRDGCNTWKEFYVNDAGNQIHKFAVSINARYMQLIVGEENFPFPEEGYHGDDIKELAKAIYEKHGNSWKDLPEEERLDKLAEYGLSVNIPRMESDLKRYGIVYDQWFFESSLHNSGYVAETVELLAGKGWTYEKDGALWLNTTALLKQKFLAEGKSQEQVDKLQKQIKDADSSAQKQTASYEKLLTGVKAYLADDKIQAAIAVADCKKSDFGSSEAKEIYTTIHTVTDAQIQALLNEGKRTAYTSYDGAIAIYRNVLKLKPKHQDAMYQIGYCYQKKQDNKKAKKWYRKAIKVDPNSAIANKANNYLQQIEQQGTQGQ